MLISCVSQITIQPRYKDIPSKMKYFRKDGGSWQRGETISTGPPLLWLLVVTRLSPWALLTSVSVSWKHLLGIGSPLPIPLIWPQFLKLSMVLHCHCKIPDSDHAAPTCQLFSELKHPPSHFLCLTLCWLRCGPGSLGAAICTGRHLHSDGGTVNGFGAKGQALAAVAGPGTALPPLLRQSGEQRQVGLKGRQELLCKQLGC